ncbi:MAG TPA: cupredoxin family copper-binding protein [Candidatus Acidoferrales bacterium]|nr:cupredoxin family copper-binding protein [Candidatus Acidoferrales bacterium]
MRNIKTNQSVVFTWSALALVAIVSIMTLRGALGIVHAANAEPSTGSTEVKIDNFAFTPGVITVKAGTQVTWINHDDIPHTVDSTEGKFKSAALDTEDKFQFRFTEPGEYPFFCRMHPKMTGKIIVQP